jgi:hypothetical protein
MINLHRPGLFFEQKLFSLSLIAQRIRSINIDKPFAPRYINYTQNLHAVYWIRLAMIRID